MKQNQLIASLDKKNKQGQKIRLYKKRKRKVRQGYYTSFTHFWLNLIQGII
jgi:hypothetical protein